MIRLFALLFMLLAHIGYLYFPDSVFLLMVGRIAFPLFAWGIAQGYKNTKNPKQYWFRIFALALLSQYPYYLIFENNYLNVCFTLSAALLILMVYNSRINKIYRILLIFGIFMLGDVMNFEYGMYGLAIVLIFYLNENNVKLLAFFTVATLFGIYFYNYNIAQLFSIIGIILIIVFKKYNFKIPQYVTYSFYPLHLIIFYLINFYFY